jgi:DNA repair photolyase
MDVLLERSECRIRVLTKSAAVVQDFDLIEKHRYRVLVGLSLTAPPSKTQTIRIVEPHASSIQERIQALRKARARNLRVYGMLCPCLPGIADDKASLCEMAKTVLDLGAEEIWLEPVKHGAAVWPGQKRAFARQEKPKWPTPSAEFAARTDGQSTRVD